MASITFRKDRQKWQAKVRLTGFAPESNMFDTKKDAVAWAGAREKQLKGDRLLGTKKPPEKGGNSKETILISEIIVKYREYFERGKSYKDFYKPCLDLLERHRISGLTNTSIRMIDFTDYKNERLLSVSAARVKSQLGVYRKMLKVASEEWGYEFPLLNVEKIGCRASPTVRVVRYDKEDIRAVLDDIWSRKRITEEKKQLLHDCFIFSLEAGVRRGELLKMLNKHYSPSTRTVSLPDTKNGDDRVLGLSPVCVEIMERRVALACGKPNSRSFPIEPDDLKSAYRRTRERTGLREKRWHDLRHEALSAYFEKGLTLPEVKSQSGHRSIASLDRYVHARVSTIVSKLGALPDSK